MVIDCPVAGGGGGVEGKRILSQLSALGTRPAHPLTTPAPAPLPPSLPQENPQFQPRLQEGIRLGPFDAADEKWSKKAPWRCPAGSRPSRLQRLYADHSLVTRVVACLAYAYAPLALFPQHFLLSSSHWACQEATFTPGPIL